MSQRRKSITTAIVIASTLLAVVAVLTASATPPAPPLPPLVSEPPPSTEVLTTLPPTTEPPTTLAPEPLPPATYLPPPTAAPEPAIAPDPVAVPAEEPVVTGPTPVEYWDRMAQCETGGNWQHYPHGTWTGGLGIYNQTWLGWGGGEFAPTAGQATKEQQIIVAERIAADIGYSAWGCAATIGYP